MTHVTCAQKDIKPLDLEVASLNQLRIPTPDGRGSIRCSGYGIRHLASGAWLFTPGSHVWGVGVYEHVSVPAPVHLQDLATARWVAGNGLKAGSYLIAVD